MAVNRRQVLVSALVAGASAACAAPNRPAPRPSTPVRYVQVVAHPDDDILFMNPDLATGIQSGQSTVGIYLTGGESDLANAAHYADERQEGTRASYARMAGVSNDWRRYTVPVLGFRSVEVNELRARPDVKLVLLNLPENNNPSARHALIRLWQDDDFVARSLVTATGAARNPYPYRRASLIALLASLFEFFQPTTIRLQDAQPDPRHQAHWVGFHNHPDHVIGARLAWEAVRHYSNQNVIVQEYRDYNVSNSPINLSWPERARKKEYFAAYARHDVLAPLAGEYQAWTDRTYYRWERGGAWAAADAAGCVHAFAARGAGITHWQRSPDGTWSNPRNWPGPARPTLSVVRGPGNLMLVGQSWDGSRLLLKRQSPRGDWPAAWEVLDAPAEVWVGSPAAAVDAHGRLVLAVQGADGGLRVRREREPGSFEAGWQGVGGADLQPGVSLTLGPDGLVHAFGAGARGVVHWHEQAGHSFQWRVLPSVRPAGPPRVAHIAGRLRVLARVADSGGIAVQDLPGKTRFLPNPGGFAAPEVAGAGVVVRDSAGHVRLSGARWGDLGGQVLDHPAVVTERDGSTTLLALGPDGGLLVNREMPGGGFRGWREVTRRSDAGEAK